MANVILDGVTYNGVNDVSLKDADNAGQRIKFYLPTPPPAENDVNFYDYDGTLLYSYTAADFANISAMPANPSHTRLTAQGWNWSLTYAKNYVASYGKLNIGQMYTTASGKTEYDVDVNEATGMTATLGLDGTEKDWGDGTIDTLTSHTYATAGSYTIKLSGATLPSIENSKKVRAVRIANGVTSIVKKAFNGCYSLAFVTIPSSVTGIESRAFYYCYVLQSITIPNMVTSIGDYAFARCYSLRSIAIPSSVTSMGDYEFQYSYSLQSITFSSSVTNMGEEGFKNCYALQSITIPSGVTIINYNLFQSCSSLQSVTIPSSVKQINISGFQSCSSLTSVTIPSSVRVLSTQAFGSCSWLTTVTVLAITPPTVASNSFPANVTTIYIPNGTLETYQAATNWSTYASKLVELPA